RGGGGLVPGGVPGPGRQRVRPVGRRAGIPGHRVRGGRVLRPEVGPVQEELDPRHPHVVRGGRGNRDRPGHGGVVGRRRDRDRRRSRVGDVVDGDGHGGGGGGVAGRVPGPGRQRVTAGGRRSGVPRDGVRGGGGLGPEVGPV